MRRFLCALALVGCHHHASTSDEPQAPEPVDYVAAPSSAEPLRFTLRLSPDIEPALAEDILGAAYAWERALQGECPVAFDVEVAPVDVKVIYNPHQIEVRPWPQAAPPPPYYPDALGWAAGLPKRLGSFVTIRDGLGERRSRMVARHELGHALGLDHGDDGIMASTAVITERNAHDVCALRRVENALP